MSYLSWAPPHRFGVDQFYLDGRIYSRAEGCILTFGEDMVDKMAPLHSAAGSGGTQTPAIGGDQPANLNRKIFSATIDFDDPVAFKRTLAAVNSHGVIDFMPGTWAVDEWRAIRANAAAPTTWKTSRGIWLGSPTDTTTYAPTGRIVWDAGTTDDIDPIHTGAPAADTDVLFPAASTTTPFDITTNAGAFDNTVDDRLFIEYLAVYWVQTKLQMQIPEPNHLQVTFTAEEVLIGAYTGRT